MTSAIDPGAGTRVYSIMRDGPIPAVSDSLESNRRVVPAADSSPRSSQPKALCGFARQDSKSAIICGDDHE